jgi:hypothetical protein
MVSNVLKMEPEELVHTLDELRALHGGDTEYQQLRADLPDDWPI